MKLSFLITCLLFFNVTYAQNVGIGTTTPNQKLDVRGSTTDDGVLISVGNADGSHKLGLFGGRLNDPNPFIIWKDGDPLRFATDLSGFSELMRIMPNGNMGIGTATPTLAKLQVQGMVGNTVAMFSDIATSTGIALVADYPGIFFNSYWNNGLRSMSSSGYSSFITIDQTTGDFTINVAAVANTTANGLITVPERMRITRSGNVAIGTDNPATTALLDVSSTTQGFLPPRMTQAQRTAITAPAEGLMVYQTDAATGFYYIKGGIWTGLNDSPKYPGLTICTQQWMDKNLDVVTYRNGDPIPYVTDPAAWAALTTGAWCYYQNNPANTPAHYGKLYNWYAVNDPRGLAPAGWHVPTGSEWNTLITCLGGVNVAGGAMKVSGDWQWGPYNLGTNSSGFAGLPASYRFPTGVFPSTMTDEGFWSSTQSTATTAAVLGLSSFSVAITGVPNDKKSGLSVRCISD